MSKSAITQNVTFVQLSGVLGSYLKSVSAICKIIECCTATHCLNS